MPDCASIDPLITPYVDGDIGAPERRLVDEHVRAARRATRASPPSARCAS